MKSRGVNTGSLACRNDLLAPIVPRPPPARPDRSENSGLPVVSVNV